MGDNLISPLFILSEPPPQVDSPNYALYQKFTLFINQPKTQKYIQDLRRKCGIIPEEINKKFGEYRAICKEEGKIRKRINNL